jgi:hypothetical protein
MGGNRAKCAAVFSVALLLAAPAAADAIEDIINQVTLDDYMADLRVLTGVDPVPTNPPYTLANRYSFGQDIHVAGQWLYDEFASYGLVARQDVFNSSYGPNIIGELPGTTRPDDIYIICGHYDTYHEADQSHAPGCDDNGSGTATALMAARILSQYQFEGTLRFIAFSGEEQGLVGSAAYAQAAQVAGENIVGVINLDMFLHPGFDNVDPDPDYDLDIRSNPASLPLAQFLAGQFGLYTPIDIEVHPNAGSGSDYYSFWQHGYNAVGLSENTSAEIWGGSNDSYHQLSDTIYNPDYDWQFGIETVRGAMAGMIGLAGLVPEPTSLVLLALLAFPLTWRRRA